MPAERSSCRLVPGLAMLAVAWSGQLHAETICTHVSTGGEHPVPLDERESLREVQSRVQPAALAKSETLVAEGRHAEAVDAYRPIFDGFVDNGLNYGADRCLSQEFYQRAATSLRVVASRLAKERIERGRFLNESHSYGGPQEPGALELLLTSNQYDWFIEQAFDYATSELLERDIHGALGRQVDHRLRQLEQDRDAGGLYGQPGFVNDLTPLLDEELAAFDKLADFEEKLRAHLAPLYPKITDHWLAEEAKNFADAGRTDGMIPKGMMFGRATTALENGIERLDEHPEELGRLRTRANTRGNTLMTQKQYEQAENYFEIAGNEERAARAARLAETQHEKTIKSIEASVKAQVEKMQKSDEEKAAFQDEADEMAAEFGFDLED